MKKTSIILLSLSAIFLSFNVFALTPSIAPPEMLHNIYIDPASVKIETSQLDAELGIEKHDILKGLEYMKPSFSYESEENGE